MSLDNTRPTLMLGPAYGRGYKTAAEARAHWTEGKDFRILAGEDYGRYCSSRDTKTLIDDGYVHVSIRIEAYPYVCRIKLGS